MKRRKVIETQTKTDKKMRPFYTIYFNARMCNMRISVNDIPVLSMAVDGQCSSRYPFNNLLLESGLANIKYEALPLKREMHLREGAYLNCKVELYDMDSTHYQPISIMAHYETPSQEESKMPYIVHEDSFQVDVPYELTGWKQSIRLYRFKEQLRPMVIRKYHSIIAMMRNFSFSQYEDAFREREDIISECFFLSEEEKRNRMKEVEDAIMNCSEIAPLLSTDKLEFAADGRLVRLIKGDGESALRIRNAETGEETMIELWLHMKQGSTTLTII